MNWNAVCITSDIDVGINLVFGSEIRTPPLPLIFKRPFDAIINLFLAATATFDPSILILSAASKFMCCADLIVTPASSAPVALITILLAVIVNSPFPASI
jgi:hypothetical protein